jgi:membrane protein
MQPGMVDRPWTGPWSTLATIPPTDLVRRIWGEMVAKELMLRATAAAYCALTAMAPFLAVLLILAANLIPDITRGPGARGALGGMTVEELRSTLAYYLPEDAYNVVAEEIARIQRRPPVGLISLSLVVSLWLASSLFGTIIDALNRIHGVRETRPYWTMVLRAIGLTALEAIIVLGSLIALVVWPHLRGALGWRGQAPFAEDLLMWLVSALGVLFSFSVTSYWGPNVRHRWSWITPGSALGTLALLVSGLVLRVYVQHFANYGKTYGSLAGVMILAFWFWIAAVIALVAFQLDRVIEEEQRR